MNRNNLRLTYNVCEIMTILVMKNIQKYIENKNNMY